LCQKKKKQEATRSENI